MQQKQNNTLAAISKQIFCQKRDGHFLQKKMHKNTLGELKSRGELPSRSNHRTSGAHRRSHPMEARRRRETDHRTGCLWSIPIRAPQENNSHGPPPWALGRHAPKRLQAIPRAASWAGLWAAPSPSQPKVREMALLCNRAPTSPGAQQGTAPHLADPKAHVSLTHRIRASEHVPPRIPKTMYLGP